MLVKISGIPMHEVVNNVSHTAEQLYDVATVPVNIDIAFGGHHLASADLNPINAPYHIVDGIVHFPDTVANVGLFIINLF